MKTKIITWLSAAGIGLMLGGVTLLAPGCVGPPVVEGSVGAYYDYDYYPGLDVYYYPAGGYYHWYDHGRWRTGRHLPGRFDIAHAQPQRFRSHTQRPWTERR